MRKQTLRVPRAVCNVEKGPMEDVILSEVSNNIFLKAPLKKSFSDAFSSTKGIARDVLYQLPHY